MSEPNKTAEAVPAAVDDEPDEWDKRIFSTGCSGTYFGTLILECVWYIDYLPSVVENAKMNDCYFEKKDWRLCKIERAFQQHSTNSMASQSLRTTGNRLLQSISLPLRASPSYPYTTPTFQRSVVSHTTTRHFSSQHLAFNPTSRLQAQQALKPSSQRNTEEPSPAAASLSNGDAPSNSSEPQIRDLSSGFADHTLILDEGSRQVDWTRSFHGLSAEPFSKEIADVLTQPIPEEDVEVKPDGIIYLPEIKYRRILNKAFGPGGWGLAPRGETIVTSKRVTREYALVVHGRQVPSLPPQYPPVSRMLTVLLYACRLMSVARGEQDYFSPENISTAAEGCKSNAMVRCCKDLGVASELWDPRWIRKFLEKNTKEVFVENVVTKKKKKIVIRKDDKIRYPFKLSGVVATSV
ncbi:hypothetical protein GP486_000146 [Trichoglossum hirsutum]|uniref:Mitochondrial genome maintenance protein MGM101 n=1 Tax=Trichoglossum hirsutum TaxID=265104 RepID=A0A9P8LJF5_9PEZI|nr:hypothetical protein GP486_000146 [Trichoglossum hirsutum]